MKDDTDIFRERLAAYRRRTRRMLIAIASFIGVAIIGTVGYFQYFDPARLVHADMPTLTTLRSQYCAVNDALAKAAPNANADQGSVTETPAGEPIRWLGYIFLDDPKINSVTPGGNAEGIDLTELSALCANKEGSSSIFRPLLPELLSINPKSATYGGVKAALPVIRNVKYLVVLDVERFTPSVATSTSTMNPGHFTGTASIYRLKDAALIGTTHVDRDAVGFASVFTYSSFGENEMSQINSGLDSQTRTDFEEAIESAFQAKGISLTLTQR